MSVLARVVFNVLATCVNWLRFSDAVAEPVA
jgi:hypothetical protein